MTRFCSVPSVSSVTKGLVCAVAFAALPAAAQEPIRIGEISSYSTVPAFTVPYRNGWQLAIEELNAAGGVLGRRLEVISRDDAGKPDDATRHANELLASHKVDLLAGAFLSNVGLAVSDIALRNKVLFVAAEPLSDAIVWEKGNRYTFRLRPSTYMQAAMLVEEAAKLPAKRWATVAPNYEYGQSAVASFRALLKARRPDVEFVAEQWPALGKLEAGATAQALAAARPDAIFNVTFGADLTKFVREGNLRGLFEGRAVVSMLTGEPEYLDPLKDETPPGWIVTGYPWDQIHNPAHDKFVDSYRRRYNDTPRLGSVVGYTTFMSIAEGLRKAGSTDTEKLIKAFRGLKVQTVFGPITFRAIDQQSTLGAFVGRLELKNGRGTMVHWRYAAGEDYMPADAAVKKLRPAEAMR
ncbi:MAG TPA: ABC transporter substrate-binding protein [Burkholderiales bacterium]|nr:ABC transporter substrate-binding protein [Burkholderiales bacterium]